MSVFTKEIVVTALGKSTAEFTSMIEEVLIKMALTRTAEVIPFANARLCLGTWQGVFLWEHRNHSHERRIILSCQGE